MSRRWRYPSVRVRQRRSDPPWVVAPPETVPVPEFGHRAPRRLAFTRRGGFRPVPPPVQPVPGFRGREATRSVYARRGWFQFVPVRPPIPARAPDFLASRSVRGLPVRRGRFLDPPPALPAAPGRVGRRPGWLATVRHGAFFAPPPGAPTPTAQPVRRRPGGGVARRGQFFTLPPLPVLRPGPLPPVLLRAPRRVDPPVRRGVFSSPPWVVEPDTPVWVPDQVGSDGHRLTPPRRGRFAPLVLPPGAPPPWVPRRSGGDCPPTRRVRVFTFAPVSVAAAPPGFLASRPPAALRVRRGRFTSPLWVPVVVTRPSRRRPPGLPVRRGQFLDLPPAAAPTVGPGPLAPSVRRYARRVSTLPTRGGVFVTPVRPQQAPEPPDRAPDTFGAPGARRSPFVRRGRFWLAAGSDGPPPRILRRGSQRLVSSPRGRFAVATPPTGSTRVWRQTARPRGCAPVRRGRFFPFVAPPSLPPGPAPLVPMLYRRARTRYLPVARARFTRVPLVGLAAAPYTWPPRREASVTVRRVTPGQMTVRRVGAETTAVRRVTHGDVTIQ